MSHDKLLTRIKEGQWVDRDEMRLRSNALRAIVELHKPITEDLTDFNDGSPDHEDFVDFCSSCEDTLYPCVTIQAIEKELL